MAYDPEARKQSNTALIVGIVALVLVAGATLAYFASRPSPSDATIANPSMTVVHDTVTNNVPVPAAPGPIVVVAPTAAPPIVLHSTTERNTTVTHDHIVTQIPAHGAAGDTHNTNVIVNVPPAGAASAGGNSAPASGGGTDDANSSSSGNAAPAGNGTGY